MTALTRRKVVVRDQESTEGTCSMSGDVGGKTARERVLIALLERYAELVEPGAKLGIAGDGDSLPLPPRTYTASVRELERLLTRMRDERRSQWFHVTERYLRSTTTRREVQWNGGKWATDPHSVVVAFPGGWTMAQATDRAKKSRAPQVYECMVASWSPQVRQSKVDAGVEWLAEEWSLPSEPMLPQEVLVAA